MIKLLKPTLTCLLFFVLSQTFAQTKTITGLVTDSANNPIAGATVSANSKHITTTDAGGKFSLSVPANATSVQVSFVGMETSTVSIANTSDITVSLKAGNSQLNDVVVVGYGTQKRKDLTGSVSSVTAATIEKVPVVSASQALQGRAAGVQVTNNDGAPGGNISILIRGTGSLASYGNEPLYVVDGYPVSTGINTINPGDIASIDVLKDASATAIYGIRAANGVVIITTKKGLKGKTQLSVDAYDAFQSTPKKYDLLNAQQFAALSNDVEASDSTHSYHGLDIWHTPDQLHNVDWQDALYRTGLTQSYTLGIRGGTDKLQSAVSAGFYKQKGIVEGSYFRRFTLNLNMDYQPVKWLKSSTSAKYAYSEANNPLGTQTGGGGSGLYQLYINPPTLDDGNKYTYQIKDGKGNYGFYNPLDPNVYKFSNPFYSIDNNQSANITNYILATTSLEATIIEGLRIKTNAGVNFNNFNGSYFQPGDSIAHQQYPSAITNRPFFNQNSSQTFEWLWENTIAYDKTFGKHTINFVGGISAQKNTNTFSGAQGNPPNNTLRNISNLDPTTAKYTGGQNIYTLESQFARLTYNFADKYLITGTIRRDGSSKFDTGHKYGVFPSGAVAWRIKEESFLQSVTWLSDLKIRGSYGELGNQNPIGLFQYQALYNGNYAPSYNGNVNGTGNVDNFGYPFAKIYQNGIAPVQPPNSKLKWETDYETDIGLDAGFLNNALTVTFDWYKRKSKDFLLSIETPAQTGFLYQTRNIGSMNNEGEELAINYNGNKGKDFQFNVGLTLTHNKNTLTSIASGVTYLRNFGGLTLTGTPGAWDEWSRSYIGQPVGEFYGYKAIGIFQTKAQIDGLNSKSPTGTYWQGATSPGDRYYADVNGDGYVNADSDRVALGNPQPKFFGGLNLDFSYKAWDVNIYLYGSFGNKILNYVESDLESFMKRGSEGVENVSEKYFNDRWTPSNPSNRYARALANDNSTLNSVPSSAFVENGSFVKCKNLTIGYTLPAGILQRAAISKVRIYASTQNLFTITKYSGIDPEIGVQNGNATQNGVDTGIYPSSRFYTVGLNVTF